MLRKVLTIETNLCGDAEKKMVLRTLLDLILVENTNNYEYKLEVEEHKLVVRSDA